MTLTQEQINQHMWNHRNKALTRLKNVNSNSGNKDYKSDWLFDLDEALDEITAAKKLAEQLDPSVWSLNINQ